MLCLNERSRLMCGTIYRPSSLACTQFVNICSITITVYIVYIGLKRCTAACNPPHFVSGARDFRRRHLFINIVKIIFCVHLATWSASGRSRILKHAWMTENHMNCCIFCDLWFLVFDPNNSEERLLCYILRAAANTLKLPQENSEFALCNIFLVGAFLDTRSLSLHVIKLVVLVWSLPTL